jgi:DNA-directed RNA polymerase specialized sigma24 family protein
MTKEKLEQLTSLKEEIRVTEAKLSELYGKEMPCVKDRVKASGKEYPYVESHATIYGRDEAGERRRGKAVLRLEHALKDRKAKALELQTEIEEYINTIEDSRIRLMIEYRYVDGNSSKMVGRRMNCDRTTVERTIDRYLKEH